MKRELLIAVGCAIGGAAAGVGALLFLHPLPRAQPAVSHADPIFLEAQRPKLEKRSLGQKLTTTRIRGQVTIADAPSAPAQLAVRRYCDPVNVDIHPLGEGVNSGDSASSKEIPPPVLPDFGGKRNGPRLELFSTLNNERRWEWSGNVRGRVQWQSSGDTVLVSGDRLWVRVLRGAPGCAAKGAAGGAIGGLSGQDLKEMGVTAAVTALACAF